jgi:hypothetical protein
MLLPDTRTIQSRSNFGLQLFALSFVALFLELMLIRWVPAVVRLVAYYANLMLISSFLGLGIGALLARRGWNLFRWFPVLLLLNIGLLLLCARVLLPTGRSEARFFAVDVQLLNYISLVAIFVFNTILFIPIGERIGQLFHKLPALRAYSWDLGGSLCGTLCFGLFSLFYFSPLVGMIGVMVVYLVLAEKSTRLWGVILFPVTLLGVFLGTEAGAIWSPYHYITVAEMRRDWPSVQEPPSNLRAMMNPPVYWMRVGRDFYQQHGTIEMSRYSPGEVRNWMQRLNDQYLLPHQISTGAGRVAVMGAGGGMDVEAALMAGARHVDAVEIDPVLVKLSLKYNSSGVYEDPRVKIHVDDGRAFLRKMEPGYDMIVFGYLDSQSLFSSMSNLRMDGYIYTVESMRTAFSRLSEDGVLALSFATPTEWLPAKLVQMVEEATGRKAIVYSDQETITLCVPRGAHRPPPPQFGRFQRVEIDYPAVDLPTDDWPYLYLSKRTIPSDYLTVIASLVLISIVAVAAVRGTRIGPGDGHFFFLGLGFLLLQTKSITDCSLYFGTTWLVTTIVIAGVLLMVLGANLIAIRLKVASRWYYLPLLASLVLLYAMPRDLILAQPFVMRLAWSLLIVPLPIFFAGLIFSTTFRESANPSVSFGTNLIGATVGGFCEYLGMAFGSNALALLVMAAYIASWMCRTWGRENTQEPADTPLALPAAAVDA